METSLTQYLINKGYRYNVVIKHDNIISTNIYTCPSHNPYLINQWINNKSSFAIIVLLVLPREKKSQKLYEYSAPPF